MTAVVHTLSPWDDYRYTYCDSQLTIGSNSNSLLEVVSILNINNNCMYFFGHGLSWAKSKYNPRIYLGSLINISKEWIYDTESDPHYPQKNWPESY